MGNIFNPVIYQGKSKKSNYFEGWYYKFVTPDLGRVVAVIIGVSKSVSDPHSFIQVNDTTGESHYYRFDSNAFKSNSSRELDLSLGTNHFTMKSIQLNLEHIKGQVELVNTTPYRGVWPGIMGPFSFIPSMECSHGVVSLNHSLRGSFTINSEEIDFSRGKGYIEKDWGKSFPREWIWLQGNSFKDIENSMMLSIAHIPWLGKSFRGFLGFLKIGEKVEYFSTYNFSKLKKVDLRGNRLYIKIKKRSLLLEIEIELNRSQDLIAPTMGIMDRTIKESIDSVARVKLFRKDSLIYEGVSGQSGLEITTHGLELFKGKKL